MRARIYRPTKTAMQSGKGQTRRWRLDFETTDPRFIEPLMGWTGTRETATQVRLTFESCEAAVAFAKKHGIDYEIVTPNSPRLHRKAYADNFSYHRLR